LENKYWFEEQNTSVELSILEMHERCFQGEAHEHRAYPDPAKHFKSGSRV
jgi:hypothetical protein